MFTRGGRTVTVVFLAVLFWLCAPAAAVAQSLSIASPAAGSAVEATFDVRISGPAGARVGVFIDDEEFATITLDRKGEGQVRLAAPEVEKFRLELRQLDGADVVASTSVRLKLSSTSTKVPPPPSPSDADGSETPAPTEDGENAAPPGTDELPPPPPPPGDDSATGDDQTADEFAPPPPIEESDDTTAGSTPTPTVRQPGLQPMPPSAGTRILRIFVQGLAAMFAVPTAWVIGAVSVGIFTGFDNDVERQIAWSFAVSGILGSTVAVWTTGAFLDGNGSLLATLLGATVTTGLTMILVMADTSDGLSDDDAFFVGAAMGSMVGIVGAIAGYELTSDTDATYSKATGTSDAILGVGPTPDGRGFMLGIGGRF